MGESRLQKGSRVGGVSVGFNLRVGEFKFFVSGGRLGESEVGGILPNPLVEFFVV